MRKITEITEKITENVKENGKMFRKSSQLRAGPRGTIKKSQHHCPVLDRNDLRDTLTGILKNSNNRKMLKIVKNHFKTIEIVKIFLKLLNLTKWNF